MIRKKWTKYVCLVLLTWLMVGCAQKPKYIIGVSQCSEDIWREKQNAELRTAAYFHEGVELRFTTNVSDNFKIRSNTYRLKNALTHLMDNAMKFTELGHVELRCEHNGDRIRFIVTDTGCGIKEEDRDRIFDTFQKGDDFMSGVGLGLPICRRLIHSLGGEVSLDETYTNGARFIITV